MMEISPPWRRPSPLLLLVVAAWVYPAGAFMNFNQQCRAFSCPGRQLPVPKTDFEFTANGCGTAALPIHTKTDFSACCNWHDVCYSTCGMKKATCEKRLDKCMRDTCALLQDAAAQEECESTAKLFSLGAQMVACPAFQNAQREACKCVPKAKAPHAHRQRLVHFLTQNGAPAEDLKPQAVEALLAKYNGHEPKMFLRLAVKYPDAVKVDKTKKNFMEDIFKTPGGGEPGVDRADRKGKFTVGLQEDEDEEERKKKEAEDDRVDEHIEL